MPQIAQIGEIYASQLFWLTITFGLVFLTIGLGMLPKVQSTVDARDKRIAADLAAAEAARESADALEEKHRQAMEQARADSARAVAEAKAEAGRLSEQRLAEAMTALDSRIADSQQKIGQAREAALAELQSVAAEATQEMVERIAGLQVDRDAAAEAVRRELVHG